LPFNIKRVAYAISFGVDFWNTGKFKKYHKKVISEVQKFFTVSVREQQGIKICADNFGVDATLVVDPTLLVDKRYFVDLILSNKQTNAINQIAYYKLDYNSDFEKTLQYLSEYLKIGAQDIFHKHNLKSINEFEYLSIQDWLESIRDSALIVPDSYHGVCLSIIFHKQFIYYANAPRGVSRTESLLSVLDISNRIYSSFNAIVSDKRWEKPIEYSLVDKKLDFLKLVSKNFLLKSLANGINN